MAPSSGQPVITRVTPGSPAGRAGLAPGDRLLAVEGRPVGDIIDFCIAGADSAVTLIASRSGRLRRINIIKDPSEPLGIYFDSPTITPVIRCRNRCIFCFVDQNPAGLRPSLYLKDDDYRLSFLYGNFVSLNHLSAGEFARVLKLRLAPLYVSVHSTNPVVRRRLFRSPGVGRGLKHLYSLARAGLAFHAQIVLCPGYNTGSEARRTIRDLAALGKNIRSLALVPVGLTAHRPACSPVLEPLKQSEAARLLEQVSILQKQYRAERGSRFVFLSDEIYAAAGAPYPGIAEYEDFPQLENGIGLARLFLQEVEEIAATLPPMLPRPLGVTLVTGVLAAPLVERLHRVLAKIRGLKIQMVVAKNRFFGPSVTTAGLLAGSDLAVALRKLSGGPGEAVFIPSTALKDGTNLFLDNTTPADLAALIGTPVLAAGGPAALLAAIQSLTGSKPVREGRERG